MRYISLHKQLQADYDTLQENARLRDDVEHITRHDLKGSLAGVIGVIQSLTQQSAFEGYPLEQLRIAEEAALQTLNMINLSTELYKIESGTFQLDAQPVDISDVIRQVVGLARKTYATRKLNFLVALNDPASDAPPTKILGDALLCYSLFQNLIKNACEAAPDNSPIEVVLHDENPVKLTITNTGAVPMEIRDTFFDKYITHGKSDGTGLGTYSSKLFVEAQQGNIKLDISDKKNQTTITVTLPRQIAS